MTTAERAKRMVEEWRNEPFSESDEVDYYVPKIAALLDLLVEARAAITCHEGYQSRDMLVCPWCGSPGLRPHLERIDKVLGEK